jgi:hypothetical protein
MATIEVWPWFETRRFATLLTMGAEEGAWALAHQDDAPYLKVTISIQE